MTDAKFLIKYKGDQRTRPLRIKLQETKGVSIASRKPKKCPFISIIINY